MPAICFLCTAEPTPGTVQRHDNAQRLPAGFAKAGWDVTVVDHQALTLADGQVVLQPGAVPLNRFDLIWILGFGPRASFMDRMQLLQSLPEARFVNSPRALLSLHAKYFLPLSDLQAQHPATIASGDPAFLLDKISQGGDWILKPPAGSFGRSVYLVNAADRNLDVILDQLTGHGEGTYCVLQAYVPDIERGEKRVLMANGMIVGAYLRMPSNDHRVNLAQSGQAQITGLSAAERALAEAAACSLLAEGVRFAAVDIAGPWIIEYNLANPGGLSTLANLTGDDPTPAVVAALAACV